MNHVMYEWACGMLREEVETGFQRALRFTSFFSRVNTLSVHSLTLEEQNILIPLLPLGVLYSGPQADHVRAGLAGEQRIVVASLYARKKELMDLGKGEAKEHALLAAGAEKRGLGKVIAKAMYASMKRRVEGLDFNTERNDRNAIDVYIPRGDGIFEIGFDMEMSFNVRYALNVQTPDRKLKVYDSYLGSLGLGGTGWVCRTLDDVDDVVERALEFVIWHVKAYPPVSALLAGMDN